jgi:hypothetical protein
LNFLPSKIIVSPEIPWFQLAKNLASHNQRQQLAFGISPVYGIPPSAITGTPPLMAAATSRTAEN